MLCLLLFQGLQQLSVQWQSAWTVHPCTQASQHCKFLFSRPMHHTPSVHLKDNLFPTPVHSSAWSSILPQSSGPLTECKMDPTVSTSKMNKSHPSMKRVLQHKDGQHLTDMEWKTICQSAVLITHTVLEPLDLLGTLAAGQP